jgi:four helix bundle protein
VSRQSTNAGRTLSGFEKLDVYRTAEAIADAVWVCARSWDGFSQNTIGRQIVRAADSVPANIAEGYGRSSPADNRRCVRIAIGSLYETKNWLRRAYARNLMTQDHVEKLRPLIERLLPMLNAYYRSIGERAAKPDELTTHHQPPTTPE